MRSRNAHGNRHDQQAKGALAVTEVPKQRGNYFFGEISSGLSSLGLPEKSIMPNKIMAGASTTIVINTFLIIMKQHLSFVVLCGGILMGCDSITVVIGNG
jgi:hypothetical protein